MVRGIVAIATTALLALITACRPSPSTSAASSSTASNGVELNAGITSLAVDQLPPLAMGQVIYIPIYSEIYDFDQNRTFQLTATLSLRNTDPRHPLVIEAIDYYDSAGVLVKRYLSEPIQLAALASTAVVVDHRDQTGGTGANFLVTWRAGAEVNPPVAEAIMISTASQQGVSFISPGRVIQDR